MLAALSPTKSAFSSRNSRVRRPGRTQSWRRVGCERRRFRRCLRERGKPIFAPEARGEMVSTVTSWPEERRRVSLLERGRERGWGRVFVVRGRPLVVLWVEVL